MSVHELLHWWNLIFLLPLLMSVLWILSTMFAGMHVGHGIGHVGHDIGHGLGHVATDAGHAIHGMAHHDVGTHGAGAHTDAGAHAGHTGADGHAHTNSGAQTDSKDGHNFHIHNPIVDSDSGFFSKACWFLGINDVPVTMLMGVFCLSWGVLGLLSNQIFAVGIKYPAVYILPSVSIAFFGGFIVTRIMAAIVAKFVPTDETYAVNRFDLVGLPGRTLHSTDSKIGTIDVKDKYGNVHRIQAKTEEGTDSIPPSTDVIVVDYDDSDKRFIIRKGIM